MLILIEIIFAAYFQSNAFSYHVFEVNQGFKNSLLKAIDEVFSVKDVIEDT